MLLATTVAQIRAEISATGAAQTKRDIDSVGASVDRTAERSRMMGAGMLAAGAALGGGFLAGLGGAMKLEQAMANVNAALGGIDASALQGLEATFQEIGVNSQFSATAVAGVGEELAKAGFSIDEIMQSATQGVVDLAQATGADLTTATTGVVQAFSMWDPAIVGVTDGMTDATRVADILTTAANESSAGIEDIIGGMRPLGPIASSMGIGYDEAAAAIAVFTNAGLKGADAGISLARGLQNLADPTSEAATMMGDLGIAAFDTQGNFIGFPALFDQLKGSMGGMSDQAQLTALSTIFGAEAMDVMGLAILNGADPLEQMIALMGESGSAAEQSAIRMDTLGAQFDTLKEGVMTLLASFVSGLIPGFRMIVDGANMFVDALMRIPGPIKTIIGAVIGIGAVLLTAAGAWVLFGSQISAVIGILGGIAFGPIIAGIAALAGGAGLVYAAWRSDFGGLRSMVKRFFSPVTRAVDAFKETWAELGEGTSDVMERVLNFGGQAENIITPVTGLSRVLQSLSSAVRAFGGRDIPFFDNLADGLQRAAGFVDRFKAAWDSLGISDTMQQVNQWGNVTGNAMGNAERAVRAFGITVGGQVGQSIGHFFNLREAGIAPVQAALMTMRGFLVRTLGQDNPIANFAIAATEALYDLDNEFTTGLLPALRELATFAAVEIGSFVVRIGGWVIEQAVDLGTAVYDWITDTAIPAIGRTARSIGDFVVRIGGWLVEAAVNLGSAVLSWIRDTALPTVGRAALAIGEFAVRIGGWLVEQAVNLGSAVHDWITNTALPAIGRTARDIGDFVVRIGGWLVEQAVNIGSAVHEWITNTALPTISRTARNIGNFLVRIGGWLVEAGKNLGQAVIEWVQGTAVPTITTVAQNIGNFAVKIADWTVSAAVMIGERVWTWITGTAIPTITRVAMDIGTFALKIADWTVSAAVMIGERVWSWITSAVSTISRVAFDIGAFAIKISSWVKEGWADLKAWVSSEVQAAWTGNTGNPYELGIVSVKVGTWDVEVDVGSLYKAINDKFIQETTVTQESLAGIQAKGEEHGKAIRDAFMGAMGKAFGGGGGGGDGAGGDTSGNAAFYQTVKNYVDGLIEGVDIDFSGLGDKMQEGLVGIFDTGDWQGSPIDVAIDFAFKLKEGVDIASKLEELLTGDVTLGDVADFAISVEFITDAFTWPEIDQPDWWKNPLEGWSWPTLPSKPSWWAWPDMPSWWGNPFGNPEDNPNAPPAPDSSNNQPQPPQPPGGRRGLQGAGGGATFASLGPMPNFAPVLAGIQNLKAQMQSAIPIAGQLKTAISGISGGGGISAAGAGALKAAGGGGPFASLISGMQTAKREAESFRTAMGTIGATALAGLTLGLGLVGLALTTFGTNLTTAGTALTTFGTNMSLAGVTYMAGFNLQLSLVGLALTTFNTSLTTAGTAVTTFGTSLSLVGTTYLAGLILGLGLVGIALSTLGTNLTTAGTAFTTFGTNIGTAMQTALVTVQTGIANITTALHSAVGPAGTAGQNVGSSFSTNLSNGLSPAPGHAQVAVAGVTSAMHAGVGPAGNAGQNMGSSFSTSLSNGLAAAEGIASSAVISVTSQLHSGVGPAGAAGRNIGNAFASGMESALGRIRTAASAMVSAANRAVRAKAMISSPSRLFMGLGSYMGEGLTVGMLSELGKIAGASNAMANAAIPNMGRGLDTALSRIPEQTPARGARGAATHGAPSINVTVHVAGNVTAEDDLKLSIVRAVSEGIVEGTRQRNRAMGVV